MFLAILTEVNEFDASVVLSWLSAGGATAILTSVLTFISTKSRKRKIQLDAKDEQIEALIQQTIDLKGIVFNLTEMTSMLMQTSKGLPPEIKEKAGALVDVMRKKYGLKITESVTQVIAMAKEKSLLKKEEAIAELTNIKTEATKTITGLKDIADEILSKEINKG